MVQQFHFCEYNQKKNKTKPENPTNSKRYVHLNVQGCIIYNCQDMEATQVSTDRWIDREDVVYIYNEYIQP